MRISVLLILVGLAVGIKAQDTRAFEFEGTVYDKVTDEKLESYLVDVYEGNTIIQSVVSEKKGKFEVNLFGSGEYTIDIYQKGYYPKRVVVMTNIPEDIKRLPTFKFDVTLIPTSEYADLEEQDPFATSIFDFPYMIFEFDKDLNDLTYRKVYFNHMKEQYEMVADLR